jgi:hypothetical protein
MENTKFKVQFCQPHFKISLELNNDFWSFLEELKLKERILLFVTPGAGTLAGNILRTPWWAS